MPMQEKPHVVLCPIYSCGAFDATRGLAWRPGGRQIDQMLIFSCINSHIFWFCLDTFILKYLYTKVCFLFSFAFCTDARMLFIYLVNIERYVYSESFNGTSIKNPFPVARSQSEEASLRRAEIVFSLCSSNRWGAIVFALIGRKIVLLIHSITELLLFSRL